MASTYLTELEKYKTQVEFDEDALSNCHKFPKNLLHIYWLQVYKMPFFKFLLILISIIIIRNFCFSKQTMTDFEVSLVP